MKHSKIILLSLFIVTRLATIQAQTADEIINKNIEANGGKDKLRSIKTAYFEGDVDIMGNHAPCLTYVLNGKGYKNEVDFSGQKVITCYTDKNGWTINPMSGQALATPLPADQVRVGQLQMDIVGPLFDYASKGNKVEFLGKADVNGAAAYQLKVTTRSNVESIYFIDVNSYFVSKITTKMPVDGQDIEMSMAFSNYKKTDFGMMMPFSQELSFPGVTVATTIKKIEINREIDQSIFDLPKK